MKTLRKKISSKTLGIILLLLLVIILFMSCSCTKEKDRTPPSTPTITAVSTTSSSITLSVNATDNVGVTKMELFKADGTYITAFSGGSGNYTITGLATTSSISLYATAYDAEGNMSKSQAYTFSTTSSLLIKTFEVSSITAYGAKFTFAAEAVGSTIVSQTLTNNVSGEVMDVTNLSTKEVTNLNHSTAYTFTLTVKDDKGVVATGKVNFNSPLGYTAVINTATSYEASQKAEDKILFGRSVAKAFVLDVATPGTVQIEVLGSLPNGSSPIAYYWINSKDDSDFNLACSTLNSKLAKTAIPSSTFTLNLQAGINVICFKTAPYASQIANGAKVGLKVTGKNFEFTNVNYTADASTNVAARLRVVTTAIFNFYMSPGAFGTDYDWCEYRVFPEDENGNYDPKAFPKIEKMAIDLSAYARDYPALKWIDRRDGSVNFTIWGGQSDSNTGKYIFGIVFAKSLVNNLVKYENDNVFFSGPKVQMANGGFNYSSLLLRLNIYNSGTTGIGINYTWFDPFKVGWKFTGNPELELWTDDSKKPSIRLL